MASAKPAVFAALLACVCGVAAGPAQAKPRPVPFMRGVTLGTWGSAGYAPAATRAQLRRLRARHVDTVTLLVSWGQSGKTSTTVAPNSGTVPTPALATAIRSARKLGMKVVLRPYVDPLDGTWRGLIEPRSVNAWFRSYDRFILSYASLARREHVRGFVVGSEMSSLARYSAQWRSLVGKVRHRFRGFVTYQANWYLEPVGINWWDAVDAIDVSAWYELTDKLNPTVSELVQSWTSTSNGLGVNWFAQVRGLQHTWNRPVMFGEIGYRASADTAAHPWELDSPSGVPASAAAQRRAYEAAFRVWYGQPWFKGFDWWYVPAPGAPPRSSPSGAHQLTAGLLRLISRRYGGKR